MLKTMIKRKYLLSVMTADVLIIALAIISAFLLMLLVYSLPAAPMKENVRRSHATFDYEGVYPLILGEGYKSSQLDNCTDAIMLGIAIYPGNGTETTAEKAMQNEYYEYEETLPHQSLNDYANDVVHTDKKQYTTAYTRYWHGYLVFLKPLLLFFDFGDIRCLNMMLQGALFLWIVCLLCKKNKSLYVIPFALTAAVFNPLAEALSLQFSSVYYLMMLAVIILLMKTDFLSRKKRLYMFFLLIGILTSFMDFLTYPLVTLGIPLLTALILYDETNFCSRIKKIAGCSLQWGLGYTAMWAGKWLLASLVLKNNGLSSAIRQVLFRASMTNDGEKTTYLEVVTKNIRVLLKWPYLLLFTAVLVWLIWLFLKYRPKLHARVFISVCIPFIIIALFPFIWYLAAANHSIEHYWFTYRILAIPAFASSAMMIRFFEACPRLTAS